MFAVFSIALMIVWLFLYSAFHVSAYASSVILSLAFSLYFFDWWMHSRTRRSHDRSDVRSKNICSESR